MKQATNHHISSGYRLALKTRSVLSVAALVALARGAVAAMVAAMADQGKRYRVEKEGRYSSESFKDEGRRTTLDDAQLRGRGGIYRRANFL